MGGKRSWTDNYNVLPRWIQAALEPSVVGRPSSWGTRDPAPAETQGTWAGSVDITQGTLCWASAAPTVLWLTRCDPTPSLGSALFSIIDIEVNIYIYIYRFRVRCWRHCRISSPVVSPSEKNTFMPDAQKLKVGVLHIKKLIKYNNLVSSETPLI